MNSINYLRASGINVYAIGGERHDHLDVSEYANILRRSKITLGFSRSSSYHVINARAFEATLCGALLLEEEGVETPQMFTPYVDYVPYDSLDDLVVKAKYYLANENARNVIAESGCGKCHVRYSAQHFWQSVFKRALHGQNMADSKEDVTQSHIKVQMPPTGSTNLGKQFVAESAFSIVVTIARNFLRALRKMLSRTRK